jgi:hypothetical protein
VILAIPPFNYPVNLAVSKIAPALIAGNSIVLKPPTQVIISLSCFHKLSRTLSQVLMLVNINLFIFIVPSNGCLMLHFRELLLLFTWFIAFTWLVFPKA